ncbi:MAG: hypothetical protein AAGF20_09815 [Pseudomonadota bacterium]
MIAGPKALKTTKDRGLLVIARNPSDLHSDALPQGLLSYYSQAVIWVIDAFRHEFLPSKWRLGPYDAIGVCRPNDVEVYEKKFGKPVIVLPWGADVLNLGSGEASRDFDVMRVGRQPAIWDDDASAAAACAAAGLRFAGRPQMYDDPMESHTHLLSQMARTRFVLAYCNLAAPAPYTHETQSYMTARWTDALAAGASVAGVPPHQDKTTDLLWPEALLPFDRIDLKHNIAALQEASAAWTAELAQHNYRQALLRLDWRWRLKKLSGVFEVKAEPLEADLKRLTNRASAMKASA